MSPDNFLDIGGGASPEKVTAAFEIMLLSRKSKLSWINIFGGIMKCDVIAEGIVEACRHVKLSVPLIVRMKERTKKKAKKFSRTADYRLFQRILLGMLRRKP